jgi:polyhydroxyalkanoate synthesis repressor PhaR
MRSIIALHTRRFPLQAERVIIRKYGNRRLYNSSASRYINLEELAELVRNGNDVQVVDAKTGEDLTRVTLTQIIVEDAKDQHGGLPLELLRQLVVASNTVAREGFMWFKPALNALEGALESSIRSAGAEGFSPLQTLKNLVSAPAANSSAAELQELKQRIAELEARQGSRKRSAKKPTAAKARKRSTR